VLSLPDNFSIWDLFISLHRILVLISFSNFVNLILGILCEVFEIVSNTNSFPRILLTKPQSGV
jgi:hypothetical protein